MTGRGGKNMVGSRRQVFISLGLAALVFILAGAIPWPCRAAGMTHEEERKLGKEVLDYIAANRTIVEDQEITAYINELGGKIVKTAGSQPFEIRFYILLDNAVNAFAAPGGNIFINTGLIMAFESEGQLAAVLAHELAHSTGRHLAERIARNQKIGLATLGAVAAGILLGGQVGSAVAVGSMAANVQAQLSYSREDEAEADRQGLDYLVSAGYDPRCMIESFKILLRSSLGDSGETPTYLRTHPGLSDRMSFVENWVAAHPGFGLVVNRGDSKAFEAVKTKIMAHHADELAAYNYFQHLLRQGKNVSGHYGLALVYERQQKYDQAVLEFEQALKEEPANVEILTDYGQVLFKKGDYDGAANPLNRVIILNPTAKRALFLLARIQQEQGKLERSRDLYLRLLVQDQNHVQGLYNLGLVYSRLNNMARAHFNFGFYFKLSNQPDKAIYHLEKARNLAAREAPDLLARINQALEEIKPEEKERPVSPYRRNW